jgi:hypothetical protein
MYRGMAADEITYEFGNRKQYQTSITVEQWRK